MHPGPQLTVTLLLLAVAVGLAPSALPHDVVHVTSDAHLNYMPSLIKCQDGTLMIAYERLDSS